MNIITPSYAWRDGKLPGDPMVNPIEIILHHRAGDGDVGSIHVQHRDSKGWDGIGYHYYVRKNGTIFKGRPDDRTGTHTGETVNNRSIAICAEGNFEEEEMNDVQKKAISDLCRELLGKYKSIKEIHRHKDYKPTACPGKNYPFDYIKAEAFKKDEVPYPGYPHKYKIPTMRGELVKKIQTKLNEKGFNCGTVDGSFGLKTLSAVRAFQRASGLDVDGSVGNITWNALFN